MPESRTEEFVLTGYGDSITAGEATVVHFDGAERIARAGKGLAMAWGAALVMVYLLIGAMVASGGVMGAFWLRALTIMRRRAIDSVEELERLTQLMSKLESEMENLTTDNFEIRERLDQAERLLQSGEASGEFLG